jgi:hypothetical protein
MAFLPARLWLFGMAVRVNVVAAIGLFLLLVASTAQAQLDAIRLDVRPNDLGLDGYVRPGTWTPLRLTLDNPSPAPRRVLCQWVLTDSDGDTVLAETAATLSPQRRQSVWLYACPPLTTRASTTWRVLVMDFADGKVGSVQDSRAIAVRNPDALVSPGRRCIGVTGVQSLGLEPYEQDVTQHEPASIIRGLDPANLPDRWHGLAMLETLIWTADGGDPAAPGVPTDALREWVRRGGHLVICLSNGVNYWPQSPLGNVIPQVDASRIEGVRPPSWLGDPFTVEDQRITVHRLEPKPGLGYNLGDHVAVLLRDRDGSPLVVSSLLGFGRITLIGIDLTDPALVRMRLPSGQQRIWNTLFGWLGPAMEPAALEAGIKAGSIHRADIRPRDELGDDITPLIAMRETTAAALLLAILLFALYWIIAGPVGYAVLRKRGLERHSWLVFVAVVLSFSLIAWGGALLLRPTKTHIAHLTVLDVDAASPIVHAQAWLSLFSPTFGDVELTVAPTDADGDANLLSAPGFDPAQLPTGFLESRSYRLSAPSPTRPGPGSGVTLPPQAEINNPKSAVESQAPGLRIPMRATTKPLMIDYLGPLPADSPWITGQWIMPRGQLKLVNYLPQGQLIHKLPGNLRDVRVFYCPGLTTGPSGLTGSRKTEQPFVIASFDQWPPETPIDIQAAAMTPLAVPPRTLGAPWGGFLGALTAGKVNVNDPNQLIQMGQPPHIAIQQQQQQLQQQKDISASSVVQMIWKLSFFSALPPPDFTVEPNENSFEGLPVNYRRSVGRSLDLTATLRQRQILIIGFLENSEMPIPLSLDGKTVPATGWTVVRWRMAL